MKGSRLIAVWLAGATIMAYALSVEATAAYRPSQSMTRREQSDQWIQDVSFGFPVNIAYTSTLSTNQYSDVVIFLLIEDGYCSPESLRRVFEGLAARYQETPFIKIDVYSDREMLRRAIGRYKTYPDDMVLPDTPEGEELEKMLRGDLYIPKTGWARARYYKGPKDGERFFYKPNPPEVDMVEVVIKPVPPPEYVGELQTDLFVACRLGDLQMAKALIDKGANVDYKDKNGNTALVYAVGHNKPDIVRILLTHGASVDARNEYGQSALCEALSHGFHDIAVVLLENNADVNARYGPGISALHLASYKGDEGVVRTLLSRGADPNAADDNGNTPLFGAIRSGRIGLVRALVSGGALIDLTNRLGETPEIVAKQTKNQAILDLIRTSARRP